MSSWLVWLFFPMVSWLGVIYGASDSDYAYPRFLILGPTGAGKSSLANLLTGCQPNQEQDCFFQVCDSLRSCTKRTTIAQANFAGNFLGTSSVTVSGNSTIIDTPGFGDGDLEEPTLIREMGNVLKDDLKEANIIILCFEGTWDAGVLNMIEKLEKMFGRDRLWNNVIIQVTKWAYDAKSIQDRERRGITEEKSLLEINNQLRNIFHLNHSLPGVFVDSFAVYYPDDEVQTSFLQKNLNILWETAKTRQPFSFNNMEDGLEARVSGCDAANDCCEFLTTEINNLKMSVNNINVSIADIETSVANNTNDIACNTDNMLMMRDTHTHDITSMYDKIVETKLQLENNKKQTDTNTNDIDTNKNNTDTNKNNIDTNTNNINTNKNNIDSNTNNIDINTDNININRHDIATNTETIETLTSLTALRISQCGYRQSMKQPTTGLITYDKLMTDVNSLNRGGLDIGNGGFTAPTDGTYLVSIHFITYLTGHFYVKPYKNGIQLTDVHIDSRSNNDVSADSAGKTFTLELGQNDKLHMYITEMTAVTDVGIFEISFCITLIK